jgi:hypothetical protein
LELLEFAERHLRDRTVAVFCDSDWYANPLVRRQTERVADILRPYVGRVVACAPPEGRDLGWAQPITGRRIHAKRGVDTGSASTSAAPSAAMHCSSSASTSALAKPRSRPTTRACLRCTALTAVGPASTGDVRWSMLCGRWATWRGRSIAWRLTQCELAVVLGRPASKVQKGFVRAVSAGLLEPLPPARTRTNGSGGFYTEPALVRVAPKGMPTYEWRTLRQWLGSR